MTADELREALTVYIGDNGHTIGNIQVKSVTEVDGGSTYRIEYILPVPEGGKSRITLDQPSDWPINKVIHRIRNSVQEGLNAFYLKNMNNMDW